MEFLIIIIGLLFAGGGFYFYQDYKKKQYLIDYEVQMLEEERLQKEKKAELNAHIREEQKNKPFYMNIILTHGNAIGVKACLDNEGKRRSGILSIGDIALLGKNSRGEDYFFHIDEASLEIWATFEKEEVLLKSSKEAFEIREEGTPKDQGTRTQKASIKAGRQYYVILDNKHEIGILAE